MIQMIIKGGLAQALIASTDRGILLGEARPHYVGSEGNGFWETVAWCGEDASKATCLWLKNLPVLRPTKFIQPRFVNGKERWSNQTDSGQNKLPPSLDRADLRSVTYQGIADAMAEQWG